MIIFSYKISDILTEAKNLAQYGASMVPSDQTEALERSLILDRDDDFLTKYLKTGGSNIAMIMSGYTKDLYDTDEITLLLPFEFDVTYNVIANSIVFRVIMPDTWDSNIMNLLDESIKNALVNFTMYMYFKKKKMDFQTEYDEYLTSVSEIRTYIHRRLRGTRRNYNTLM